MTSNKFLARLYSTRLATVAAIRGACPAGGCAISLACDYRVMTEHGHIGGLDSEGRGRHSVGQVLCSILCGSDLQFARMSPNPQA